MAESLAEWPHPFIWKAGLKNDGIGCLAEETSKQSVVGVAWFLAAYTKIERGERNQENCKPKEKPKQKWMIWEILGVP